MLSEKQMARLNELSAIAKERDLTAEEAAERETLRNEYRAKFRNHFDNHLHNVTIIDPEGNDVTPDKLKKSKINRKRN